MDLGVDFLRSVRALERRYEVEANIELSDGALYDRFTPELVAFLRECVLHAGRVQYIGYRNNAWGTALDLLALVLSINIGAIVVRNHYRKKIAW